MGSPTKVAVGPTLASQLTPVLTRESMMRSFSARVSPCFILMRFLSRHFMAYLGLGRVAAVSTHLRAEPQGCLRGFEGH